MRQRRDFDAHVHEYAALKIPALPFQDAKCVFCKFAQHQPSPSLRSGEFKEGDATTISSWRLKLLTHKVSAYVGLNSLGDTQDDVVKIIIVTGKGTKHLFQPLALLSVFG